MISEDQEEVAALHALGLLDADEATEFDRALAADGELRALAAELREAAANLALAAGPEIAAPPAGLKARLLAEVGRREPAVLSGGSPGRGGWMTWVPWAVAAAAVALSVFTSLGRDHWYRAWSRERARAVREIAALKESSPLGQVAVCPLEPTADGPDLPRATVLWDAAHHTGSLVVVRLKLPDSGHDYQLWAVEEGHQDPVSAGVVHVDGAGRVETEFKPVGGDGEKVKAFALSLEPAGGSEKTRGPILLLGKL